jgi:hypothetical protein
MEHVRDPSPAANFKATSSVDDECIRSITDSLVLRQISSLQWYLTLPWEENGIEHIIIMSLRIIGRYGEPRIMACPYLCIVVQQGQGSGACSVYRYGVVVPNFWLSPEYSLEQWQPESNTCLIGEITVAVEDDTRPVGLRTQQPF